MYLNEYLIISNVRVQFIRCQRNEEKISTVLTNVLCIKAVIIIDLNPAVVNYWLSSIVNKP